MIRKAVLVTIASTSMTLVGCANTNSSAPAYTGGTYKLISTTPASNRFTTAEPSGTAHGTGVAGRKGRQVNMRATLKTCTYENDDGKIKNVRFPDNVDCPATY
ncbi:MAG: hypothetical protein AAF578_08900 [Pseudomonadota bacterium]